MYLLTCTCVDIHPGRVEPASPIALTTSRTEALQARRSRASSLDTFTQSFLQLNGTFRHTEQNSVFYIRHQKYFSFSDVAENRLQCLQLMHFLANLKVPSIDNTAGTDLRHLHAIQLTVNTVRKRHG